MDIKTKIMNSKQQAINMENGELKDTLQGFKPNYKGFLYQTINDLWENYIYDVCKLDDEAVEKVSLDKVGYFREWCYDSGFYAIDDYLPQSDSQLQAIIKQCQTITDY